jgi:hypothetical protein
MLVAKAVCVFPISLGGECEFAVGNRFVEHLVLTSWVSDLEIEALLAGSNIASGLKPGNITESAYPEVDIEIAGRAEFTVSDLKRHCHLVLSVEGFVEALATMRGQHDIVGVSDIEKTESSYEEPCRRGKHGVVSEER